MQIPFEGSELESPSTRALQETRELPLDAQDELDALQRLSGCGSRYTPKLIAPMMEWYLGVIYFTWYFQKCLALSSEGEINLSDPFLGLSHR